MRLGNEEIIKAIAVTNNIPTPLPSTSSPNEYLTNEGTVFKVTDSIVEAVTASVSSANENLALPTSLSVTEIDMGNGEFRWLLESPQTEHDHVLAELARQIVSLATSSENIESFDLSAINSPSNSWAMVDGYSKEMVSRVINDLQASLFAYEMAGFVQKDLSPGQVQLKDDDGLYRVVLSSPENPRLEAAFKATKISLDKLNPNCRHINRITAKQCSEILELANSHNQQFNDELEHGIDERFTPSKPVSLSR